jgi:hypothetical protein
MSTPKILLNSEPCFFIGILINWNQSITFYYFVSSYLLLTLAIKNLKKNYLRRIEINLFLIN